VGPKGGGFLPWKTQGYGPKKGGKKGGNTLAMNVFWGLVSLTKRLLT
jgi:hypothetical protein